MKNVKNRLTLKEVKRRIKGLDEETAKRTVCALVGHSKIQEFCFGYFTCARCGGLAGDSLGSVYDGAKTAVVVGHNCTICRENYKRCTWRDKFMAPEPFKEAEHETGGKPPPGDAGAAGEARGEAVS